MIRSRKDKLLGEAERHGLLERRNEILLPDGKPVGPRELSAHVHVFSTKVANVVRALSLAAGENIVIDGTLSWQPLADLYVDEFFRAGYAGLAVVDVEIPLDLALRRAIERWWAGRENDIHYGGRFVPEAAIKGCYETGKHSSTSICAANAVDLAGKAAEGLGHGTLRRFDVGIQKGRPYQTSVTEFH